MNSDLQFEAIVRVHYQPLFKFAMSLTHSENDAWDLTQQTFLAWASKGHQLRDVTKLKTWLYTTMHRAFLGSRRRQTRFPHHELELVESELPTVTPLLGEHLDAAQVLAALARVDEVYQAAVSLFYLDDCSYKDIAVILNVPIGTIKSRIARGIVQLRQILLGGDHASASSHPDTRSRASDADNSFERPAANLPSAPSRSPESSAKTSRPQDYNDWHFGSAILREHLYLS